MTIDIEKLKADRRELERRIRGLELVLRAPWTEPMAARQRELALCKREATQLCVLRAWVRGRLHLPDRDRCEAIAERRARAYPITTEGAA